MMNPEDIHALAGRLLGGELSVDEFTRRLAERPIADVGVAQLDLDRARRCGFPEVVFGQGKSVEALERIFTALLAAGIDVLATRISVEQAAGLLPRFPQAIYNAVGRTLRVPLADTEQALPPPRG